MSNTMLSDEIVELKKEIKELKKKLEDRNPAFNENLLKKTDQEFDRLSTTIGEAIRTTVGQELLYVFKSKQMRLDFDSSRYGSRGWFVCFSKEDDEKIRSSIADLQMKKFQESLDNFAWAVQNGPG